MRFAISAVAVVVGLVLAGVIFGQPEVYLLQARQQWRSLVGTSVLDQQNDALAKQVALLQQQVMQLKDQHAADQVAAEQARQQLAALQQPPPPPAPPEPVVIQAPPVVVPERHEIPTLTRPERQEALKSAPPPLPKPKTETAPLRAEPDDMQSVLARLRQRPYTAPQPVDSPPSAQPPRPPSPSRQRLEMARTALLNGRIDDARRLLQEVQVQLVFRPVSPGEDAPAAGQGASEVARALGALSDNDMAKSQRYIERAMDEVAGTSTRTMESESSPLLGGYAPAYPSR